MVSGARTPRAETLNAFARAMDLSPSERNYLGLLVELASAKDLDTRRAVMDRILSAESYRQLRVAESGPEADAMRYVEHWWIPAIRELAMLPGFRPEPAWIASTLRPPIRPEQAAAALDTLFDLDFLRRRDDGTVEVREVRFRTDADSSHAATHHYQREVLPELLASLDTELWEVQHLVAAFVSLPVSALPEVKARVQALVEQVATVADDPAAGERRRVYQVAVQLVPVSEEVG